MHNLQTRRKKFKRVASGCKWSFCQCKNQKYLQIWLLPRFPIMSEKCIIYRPLKHQKSLKTIKGVSWCKKLNIISANSIGCVISWSHTTYIKNVMAFSYGWGLTLSRLQSHYEEIVYFLPLSFQEFLALIRSISERWKHEMTLEPSIGFELMYKPSYYQI